MLVSMRHRPKEAFYFGSVHLHSTSPFLIHETFVVFVGFYKKKSLKLLHMTKFIIRNSSNFLIEIDGTAVQQRNFRKVLAQVKSFAFHYAVNV